MFFHFKEYIKHLTNSCNKHGVHSPFVYDFITKCLYKKASKEDVSFFEKYRFNLKTSSKVVCIEEYGAGSRVFKSNIRKVSQIVEVAGIKRKYGLLLMRMMSYFEVKTCLEIGTSLGLATLCLQAKEPKMLLTTLEGCKNTLEVAKEQFDRFGLKNIKVVLGDFKVTLPKAVKNNNYDVVYFDGNHTKTATLGYFKECLKAKHNNSIFIFDDIHWSQGMCEAWDEIKKHPEVTVTIDIFQWGIVFFRKEQRKEHFTIRL
ncbi:class I SAM-dependent methyltransferase [Flavicella sp.]|uniref:O-methyltransferase n=1 Tax=Flavicella sp. TaxID=2957742 RepID=UPI003019297F